MTDPTPSRCPFGHGNASSPIHEALPPAMVRSQLPRLVDAALEPGAGGLPTGRCLCGAVSYRILKPVERVFANHDVASRRWTGGIALTVMIRASGTEFHGWGNIVQYAASDRDRHGFCRLCGTSLFVRHVAPAAMDGMLSLSAGTLDDPAPLRLAAETHIDREPAYYAFAGDRRTMTEAEVVGILTPPQQAVAG